MTPTPIPSFAKETSTGESARLLASSIKPPPRLPGRAVFRPIRWLIRGFVAGYSGATAFDLHELPYAPSLQLPKN